MSEGGGQLLVTSLGSTEMDEFGSLRWIVSFFLGGGL